MGYMGKVRLTDADVVLLTMGTAASTAREVIDAFRKQGKKVGLCRLRMFRPFPAEELGKTLSGAKKVAVLDRDNSLGAGGIVAQELKAALFGAAASPRSLSLSPAWVEETSRRKTSRKYWIIHCKIPAPTGRPYGWG